MVRQSWDLKNAICTQSTLACSLLQEVLGTLKVVPLARRIPSKGSFSPLWLLHPKQLWILVYKKEAQAISALVFSRESKLLGFVAQTHQGNPKSRQCRVCSWKSQALLWVGTWSLFLEGPQKMFPTPTCKRLLGDFLWYWKLHCIIGYIHRTSSNIFGVVRVNGSNTRNYMVWLHIYPFLVICRSSLFSLQIKKVLKTSQLSVLWERQVVSASHVFAIRSYGPAWGGHRAACGLLYWCIRLQLCLLCWATCTASPASVSSWAGQAWDGTCLLRQQRTSWIMQGTCRGIAPAARIVWGEPPACRLSWVGMTVLFVCCSSSNDVALLKFVTEDRGSCPFMYEESHFWKPKSGNGDKLQINPIL